MRKIAVLFFSVFLVFSLVSCGNRQGNETNGTPSLVYVPEYLELGDEGESLLHYDALLDGDMLCHPVLSWEERAGTSQLVMHRHSLTEDTLVEVPFKDAAAGINVWTLGVDGSTYFVLYGWNSEEAAEAGSEGTILVKYSASGNLDFWRDITELLTGEDFYYRRIAVDDQGRTYLFTESGILLFDGNGNSCGTVNGGLGNSIYSGSFGRGSDGKVYISGTQNNGPNDGDTLYQVDFEMRRLGSGYADFPAKGNSLTLDAAGNIVTYDGTTVYTYDLNTQEKEPLFAWTDSGINVSDVDTVGILSDGRIAVFYQERQTNDSGVALLSGVDVAEAVQKQEIVLAQLYPQPDLPASVTSFNSRSDRYHITVKNYLEDYNVSEEEIEAAKTRLIADIISGNGPDILDSFGLHTEVEELVSMGAFEDLNPYLDQSSVLVREDMIENVLSAETYDGIMVSIPASFSLYTFFGSPAMVGEEMGWTYEDVIALLEANPDSKLDNFCTYKSSIIFSCMDINDYVDWETASCSFDSDEFKSLLEFVAQRPVLESLVSGSRLTEKLSNGEILLLNAEVSDFASIQMVQERFQGEVTAIGEPTSDGSAESNLLIQNAALMLSQSKVKDGVWEFIEYYLTEGNDMYRYGFPNSWSKLEKMIEETTEMIYDYGGYRFKAHVPTQEEIDQVLDVIRTGKNSNTSADEGMLRSIISEEVDAFFQGQKTVDEVADIIQRRASVYVSENS